MNAAAWVFLFAFAATGLLLVCALLGTAEQQRRARNREDWLESELDRANQFAADVTAPANVIPFRSDAKDRVAGRIAANQAKRTDWGNAFRPIGQDGA